MRVETRLWNLSFQTLTPMCISFPCLISPCVFFLDPHSAARPKCHFLFLGLCMTSLPWLAPCRASLTPIKHCVRSLPPSRLTHVAPLYALHLSLARHISHYVVSLSCLWLCQTTKNIFFIFFLKLLIELTY